MLGCFAARDTVFTFVWRCSTLVEDALTHTREPIPILIAFHKGEELR